MRMAFRDMPLGLVIVSLGTMCALMVAIAFSDDVTALGAATALIFAVVYAFSLGVTINNSLSTRRYVEKKHDSSTIEDDISKTSGVRIVENASEVPR